MRFKALANIFLLVLCAATAAAQQTTTSMTSTGYFYPLGTNQFYTACPNNGGWYLGPDWTRGGCYTSGYYHIGFDMFNSSTVTNSPVFAAATGKVIYVDPNSSWSASGGTNNTAVFVSSTSASGTNYVIVYGHLLRSSVTLQPGDIVTAGTRVGLLGSWSPPHLHFGVWRTRSGGSQAAVRARNARTAAAYVTARGEAPPSTRRGRSSRSRTTLITHKAPSTSSTTTRRGRSPAPTSYISSMAWGGGSTSGT
jgi:murein DD-endopeptidase MepM/ murein hydrolase activator NlpD